MIILFNPPKPTGSDINGFTLEGMGMLEPHLAGDLKQYPNEAGLAIKENFEFLREVTPDEAKKIIEMKGKNLKCDFPGCEFATDVPIALEGHKRGHKPQELEQAIDPSIVPVAGARPVIANRTASQMRNKGFNASDETIDNGVDADGVEWYGGGLQQERNLQPAPRRGDPGVFGG